MKTYNKYIALAALTLSLAACEQEDFTPTMDGDAVKINAAIGNMQTRVSYSGDNGATSFTNGDAIKVVNIERTSKNEATYTTDGENWTTTDAFVWNSGADKNNQFNAWYPVADYSSHEAFTIPTDQSDATKLASADWMTVSTEEMAKPADGVLDLTFEHRLAKVTVTVTEETLQFSDPSLKSAVIYSLAAENVTVASDDNGIAPLQVNESVTAIVCPGKYDSGTTFMKVTITDADNDYELNVPVNSYLTETGLTGGKHYTFDLKVGKDIVSIGKVMVADWNNGGTIDGGVAEEEVYPNIINATAMDATALNEAVVNALELEYTDLTVTLAAEPEAEMFTAIRRALIDTEGVADGSINLTLTGVTTIPDQSEYLQEGSPIFGEVIKDENGEYLDAPECVLELNSVSLPDVLTIGKCAFYNCEKLTSIYAPKVQVLGSNAFGYTALTSVEFPELKAIPYALLEGIWTLTSAKFPKVTTIEDAGLLIGAAFSPESFPLELIAEGDITFNGDSHFNVESQNYSTKVDLVLHSNKQDEVTDGNQWKGYTFKSITFKD